MRRFHGITWAIYGQTNRVNLFFELADETHQRSHRRFSEPKICAWRRTAAASSSRARFTSLACAGRTGWRGRRAGSDSRRRRCSSRCTGPAWTGRAWPGSPGWPSAGPPPGSPWPSPMAGSRAVIRTGLSQGARYAEHVARHGQLPVTGLFLVAGTALECSRRLSPTPQLRVGMTLVIGTGDRTAPYEGGPLTRRGRSGRLLKRRAVKDGELPDEGIVGGAGA